MATTATTKGNGKKAAIFAGVGAAAGFGAAKLFKAKTGLTIAITVGLAAIGAVIGYKQS